jgi:hypothetical protein
MGFPSLECVAHNGRKRLGFWSIQMGGSAQA